MENILIGSSPLKNRGIKHDVKMYTREEYLQWCKKNNVKIHCQNINVIK